jgi:putative ABC transport system permease protein
MLFNGILKITVRNFRKNITTTWIKILGLAISIASVIIIWSFIITDNKHDKGIPGSDRIFRLESHWASMPPFLGHAINQNISNQVIATRLNFSEDVGVQVNNNPFNLKDVAFADSTFFKVFPLEFIAGDPGQALNKPFSVVLSETIAKRLFGRIDIAGKLIRFENQVDFTITGVIKDQPFLHFKAEVLASMITLEYIRYKGVLKEYDGWSYPTYVLLPEGIRSSDSEKTVLDLLKKVGYKEQFSLRPFSKIYYSPEIENESNTIHGNLLYNKILLAVSIFILLLAAINFINLTIADAFARSKEVSLKKLQGASKTRLVIQFLIETVIYIFISIGFSFFFIWFFNPLLNSLTGFSVRITDFITGNNILIIISGLLSFILLTGIYPGLYISSYNINTQKISASGSSGHLGIRNGLIIFQNLVSITLICCTLIANLQFQFMKKKDLGFNKNGVVNFKINSQLGEHMDLFREKLLEYPEILSVSYSSRIPGNYWGSWCCVNIEGNENKYFNNYVDADYLKTMGIKLKEGRNFSGDNPADKKTTYLINETAIKLYNLKAPIGQMITPGNGVKGQIIGIFNDFHYRGLNYEQTPLILFYSTEYLRYVNVKVNPDNTKGALEIMKKVWEEVCPAFSFEYKFLDESYDLQYQAERKFENLMFSFALLALFIGSIGLFGLSIFSTERRIKEIGIRRVNGATTIEILIMLNANFIKWVAIAFVLACPVAWYAMNKWLHNFAYKTEISPGIYVLAGVIAFGIAILTISWQSWRVAIRNPVNALRYE